MALAANRCRRAGRRHGRRLGRAALAGARAARSRWSIAPARRRARRASATPASSRARRSSPTCFRARPARSPTRRSTAIRAPTSATARCRAIAPCALALFPRLTRRAVAGDRRWRCAALVFGAASPSTGRSPRPRARGAVARRRLDQGLAHGARARTRRCSDVEELKPFGVPADCARPRRAARARAAPRRGGARRRRISRPAEHARSAGARRRPTRRCSSSAAAGSSAATR